MLDLAIKKRILYELDVTREYIDLAIKYLKGDLESDCHKSMIDARKWLKTARELLEDPNNQVG